MDKFKCPKCEAEFILGMVFCQNCGCNLKVEFIEAPICPRCNKRFPTYTKFCDIDGTKLISSDKLIPKCIKCGREYSIDTKFCPNDGGQVISEVLKIRNNYSKIFLSKTNDGQEFKKIRTKPILILILAIISALTNLYIIFNFILHPYLGFAGFIGGKLNLFILYLKSQVIGWIIIALILSGIVKFINEIYYGEDEDKINRISVLIASLSGGLSVIFLILALLSQIITDL